MTVLSGDIYFSVICFSQMYIKIQKKSAVATSITSQLLIIVAHLQPL